MTTFFNESTLPVTECDSTRDTLHLAEPTLPSITEHLKALTMSKRIVDLHGTLYDQLRHKFEQLQSRLRGERACSFKQTTN